MFLLSLFGKTKPYSSQTTAERAATIWLNKHTVPNYWLGWRDAPFRENFENALRREDYSTCVAVWNNYIVERYYGDSVRTVTITEVKVDEPFSDKV
jgi:hypothetical protein